MENEIKVEKVKASDVFDDDNGGLKFGLEINVYNEGDWVETENVEWYKTAKERDKHYAKECRRIKREKQLVS